MKIFSLKQIETPRLIIRPVKLGDEVPLNKAVNNSLKLLQKWEPWAKDPSIDTTRVFIQSGVFAWESGSVVDFPMVVIHKTDQKIIGASGYNDRSNINEGLYEIGYWCDVDYQGQGLVTEYVNALTRYAFEALSASKVVISMHVENKKSIAVAERLNFTNEGGKERDSLDRVSDEAEKNIINSVDTVEKLPPLEVSWCHEEHDNNVAKMIAWAKDMCNVIDNKAFAKSKAIVKTPWSNVLEINTGNNLLYLKQTPKDLFLEADIIKLLQKECSVTTIPEVIAVNSDYHCFIMNKCGDITLRDYFDGKLQLDILRQGIATYKDLQKATTKHIEELISLGVPDWRLDKFPDLYNDLISDPKFLTENDLNAEQQDKLHQSKTKVKELCEQLTSYGIAECLNHSDFHDNNILYDKYNKTTSIIDIGETAITHPFFSLTACLGAVKSRYNFPENSEDYRALQKYAFNDWLDDKKSLDRVIEIINILHPVYLLFAQKRFLDAIDLPYNSDNPLSVKQHDKINKGFIWFIENMEAVQK